MVAPATILCEPLDLVLSRLSGCRPIRTGWVARCPAHDDRTPSLKVAMGSRGVVMRCYAGCPTAAVVAALGLRFRDLWPENDQGLRQEYARARERFYGSGPGPKQPAGRRGPAQRLQAVAYYDYHDAEGRLSYQVVRYEPKTFRQRMPDGKGGWSWLLGDLARVPYRLPRLLEAAEDSLVFVVEGEKDVHTLERLALLATTNAGGAGNWHTMDRDAVRQAFAGKRAVVLPDNDDAGRKHALDVVKSLSGVAASNRVVELPGLPAKGDVTDWLAAGWSLADLLKLI